MSVFDICSEDSSEVSKEQEESGNDKYVDALVQRFAGDFETVLTHAFNKPEHSCDCDRCDSRKQ